MATTGLQLTDDEKQRLLIEHEEYVKRNRTIEQLKSQAGHEGWQPVRVSVDGSDDPAHQLVEKYRLKMARLAQRQAKAAAKSARAARTRSQVYKPRAGADTVPFIHQMLALVGTKFEFGVTTKEMLVYGGGIYGSTHYSPTEGFPIIPPSAIRKDDKKSLDGRMPEQETQGLVKRGKKRDSCQLWVPTEKFWRMWWDKTSVGKSNTQSVASR